LAKTLPVGTLLDSKYQLEECIGRGGMGEVYRATHVHLHRRFAVKIILPEFAGSNPKAAERFLQEARAAAAIQHPNVVAVTDFGTTDTGLSYYVMEYIEGTTLRDELQKYGAMSPERINLIFKQVLAGVSAAHRLHMVHRDLKPSNIMLTRVTSADDDLMPIIQLDDNPKSKQRENRYDLAKVVDFGLAKFVSYSMQQRLEQSEGGIAGSPQYMSPEQCEGESIDERSDIYSLGVILYHMLTGELPFDGEALMPVLSGHLFTNPPSPRAIRPDIPEELERVVLKMLSKQPHLRQQSIDELAREFEAAMAVYITREAKTANLTVQTVPPACEVYIDGEYRGRTVTESKLVIKELSTGNHSIRITQPGYLDWSESFTAPVGEYHIQAQLQGKEDFLAIPRPAPVNRNNSGNSPNNSPNYSAPTRIEREVINRDGLDYYSSPPSTFSSADILLATISVTLSMALIGDSDTIDPISAAVAEISGYHIEQLLGILVVLSTTVLNITLIVADQIPAYRGSDTTKGLFNISSTIFFLTVVIPPAVAVIVKLFIDPSNSPSNFWFIAHLLIIICCFALKRRIRSRGRVPFLGFD
jgi:eukaryotic-like serine/threonine-protein kinase